MYNMLYVICSSMRIILNLPGIKSFIVLSDLQFFFPFLILVMSIDFTTTDVNSGSSSNDVVSVNMINVTKLSSTNYITWKDPLTSSRLRSLNIHWCLHISPADDNHHFRQWRTKPIVLSGNGRTVSSTTLSWVLSKLLTNPSSPQPLHLLKHG